MPTESRNSDGQLTPSRASVDELKLELLSSLVYMHLVAALSPNSPSVFTTEVLNEAIIWCSSATPEQVRHKSAILLPMLRSGIDKTLVALPPKVPWRSLAEDAWERWKSGDISWSHGIRFGWLDQSFDCRALGLPEDLPYHAVIGIGHHADLGAVEEHMLLSDSFFLLLKAGTAYRFMKQMASRLKESSSLAPLEANALLSPQNLLTRSQFAKARD